MNTNSGRIFRPSFRENKPKTLVFNVFHISSVSKCKINEDLIVCSTEVIVLVDFWAIYVGYTNLVLTVSSSIYSIGQKMPN
jgi:hypothetical protein